jgi:hypothetical protein
LLKRHFLASHAKRALHDPSQAHHPAKTASRVATAHHQRRQRAFNANLPLSILKKWQNATNTAVAIV